MTFKKKVFAGVGYNTVGHIVGNAIRLGSSLILTRLLTPELFGLMTVAVTFTIAASMFSDIGLRVIMLREKRGDDPEFRNVVWTMQILRGCLVAGLAVASAAAVFWLQREKVFPAGSVYADPRMLMVLPLLGLAEIVRGFEATEVVVRERRLDFEALMVLGIWRQAVNSCVTILWAWADPSLLALCSGAIAGNLFCALYSRWVLSKNRDHWAWRPQEFRYILGQARWVIASSGLTFLINSTDRIYLGSKASPETVGLFGIAANLGLIAQEFCQRITGAVVLPALNARLRENGASLKQDYYRFRTAFEAIALLSGIAMLALGADVVQFLYDDRYHGAGMILRLLGISALMLAYLPAHDAFIAMNRIELMTQAQLARLVALVAGLMTLVPLYSANGVALSLAGASMANGVLTLVNARRVGLFDLWRELRYLALIALGLAGVYGLELLRSGKSFLALI